MASLKLSTWFRERTLPLLSRLVWLSTNMFWMIYCYEDGSRGRDALKHILGDSQVKALQSDGYNVYMYLDDRMVDIEHLCCMAHARAKFKYALEQGNDKDAAFILELIEKALNYMNTFWAQLFAYLNDGSYSIDNSIAERFIRPLADERKNSLFFGSDKMARVSAVYHTIISTCKMQGVSVLDYFKRFFSEIVKGRRDYEHLLPLTIGLDQ